MAEAPGAHPLTVSESELRGWLDEDLGTPWRDVTTDPLFDETRRGGARLVAREALVVSGLDEAVRIFALVGAQAVPRVTDAGRVDAGDILADVAGPARAILRGERTALNVLGRMSGIATLTREVQGRIDAVRPACRVAATRKTTPGFRTAEKRAVAHGGGDPHRYGLFDAVLVKDNHRAALGDLAGLVARLAAAHPDLPIEVEVESAADAETAARAGAAWLLVDNQKPEGLAAIAAHARRVRPDVKIEASGGITPEHAARFAPYADRVSLGALTQRARAMDVALDWD